MKAHKQIFWLTLFSIVTSVGPVSIYLYLLDNAPLSYANMDFDGNGVVTFGELAYANAYETRRISVAKSSCTEFYSLKNGQRLKLVCDASDTAPELFPIDAVLK